MAQDPNLLPVGNDSNQASASVPRLNVLTAPMPNTPVQQPVYYRCTAPNASMHRQDGKRLPFINGFMKCIMKEDIRYMEEEISQGNIYIFRCSPEEVKQVRMMEDPLGVIKEQVKQEIVRDLTVESLEKLLEERKQERKQPQPPTESSKPPGETPKIESLLSRSAALLALAQQKASEAVAAQKAQHASALTPASTGDLGGNVKSSGT